MIIEKSRFYNKKIDLFNRGNQYKKVILDQTFPKYLHDNYQFYKKVQDGFIKLSKKNKRKYLIINSNLDKNENKRVFIPEATTPSLFIIRRSVLNDQG